MVSSRHAIVVCLPLILFGGTVLVGSSGSASDAVVPEEPPTEDESKNLDSPPFPEPEVGDRQPAPLRDPFAQLPADEGAWSDSQLSPSEQATTDSAAEWADVDHGAATHDAWRALTKQANAHAIWQQAVNDLQLDGAETEGVVP